MNESTDEPPAKVNIFTQPIFLIALLLVVFNALLYLWSISRDKEKAGTSGKQAVEQVEESK